MTNSELHKGQELQDAIFSIRNYTHECKQRIALDTTKYRSLFKYKEEIEQMIADCSEIINNTFNSINQAAQAEFDSL